MKIINLSLLVISYLSISHGWQCRKGPQHTGVKQIDAGEGQVVITDGSGAYSLSDSTWNKLGSVGIKHVSVGKKGIWGVDGLNLVYRYNARDFKPSEGQKLKQLDAGGDGVIVGVSDSFNIYCLDEGKTAGFSGFSPLSWKKLSRRMVSVSCSPFGCWGVNSNDKIFYTEISPESCSSSGWTRIGGRAVMVEAGADGNVFRVNAAGRLFVRTGISLTIPEGTGWRRIRMSENIKQAAYDLGLLWLITDEDEILECSSSGWFCNSPPQYTGANQIDAGQGLVVITDDSSHPYLLTGDQWDRLGSTSLKHISVGLGAIWGVDDSDNVYKYVAKEFILDSGQELTQLDAGGDGHVVGVTSSSEVRCLKKTSASDFYKTDSLSWHTPTGTMMYVSCSPVRCWGVDPGRGIYHATVDPDDCSMGTWTRVSGGAVKVEVGKDGQVFTVNARGEVYQRTGISASEPSGTGWVQIQFPMSLSIKHSTYNLGNLWLMTTSGLVMKCTQ